eukprot:5474073-Pleurochrysis_carterae.AAC.1
MAARGYMCWHTGLAGAPVHSSMLVALVRTVVSVRVQFRIGSRVCEPDSSLDARVEEFVILQAYVVHPA